MTQPFTLLTDLLLFILSFCLLACIMFVASKLTGRRGTKTLPTIFVLALCSIFPVLFHGTWGTSREFLTACLTVCVLFFHSCTDCFEGITFDLATYIFVPCILLLRLCFGFDFFLSGLYSALVALLACLVIFFASRGKSGLGDVFVATCLGCGTFSVASCVLCLYLAFLLGAIGAVTLLLLGKITRKTKIPFAPFLLLGYATGIILFSQFSSVIYDFVGW